jgi:hypothetical protein
MSRLSPRHLGAMADCCCARRNPCYNMRLRESEGRTPGEVDERLKSHAWKACIGSNLSGVRIPLSPPKQKKEPPTRRLFLFGRAPPTGGPYPNLLTASAAQRQKHRAPRARVVPPFTVYLSQPQLHPDRAAQLPRSIIGFQTGQHKA